MEERARNAKDHVKKLQKTAGQVQRDLNRLVKEINKRNLAVATIFRTPSVW